MGHRSYLNIKTNNEEVTLFEANNGLPFFWVGLLDEDIMNAKRKEWKYYDTLLATEDEEKIEMYSDLDPQPTDFIINRIAFEKNIERTEKIFICHSPDSLRLLLDFKEYLRSYFEQKETVVSLNLIGLAGFSSAIDLWTMVLEQVRVLDNGDTLSIEELLDNDLIGCGIGFAANGFDQKYDSYGEAFKKRGRGPRKIHKVPAKFSRSTLIVLIIVLLICFFFTYTVYRSYMKEGFSPTVIIVGFTNLLFYVFSIWSIIGEIENYYRK